MPFLLSLVHALGGHFPIDHVDQIIDNGDLLSEAQAAVPNVRSEYGKGGANAKTTRRRRLRDVSQLVPDGLRRQLHQRLAV